MRLHKHQTDAIAAAQSGDNYVLTTGTGSGKSLAYIIPIVDHVLKRGSGKGIQAIVVYPMNALANSQLNELEKFLGRGFDRPPVTFRRYTGQESDDDRQEITANPPDIILTNYVMLELIMTRPYEQKLVRAARGLQFLVLDELHTYRGRQGADVAMLVRRVRDVCANPQMQVVGTSATLAEGGTFAQQRQKIAEVATTLFGAPVKPNRVIGETLQRATDDHDLIDPTFVQALTRRLQSGIGNEGVGSRGVENAPTPPHPYALTPHSPTYHEFVADPLAVWIETTFGLENEPESGRLRRAKPLSLTGPDGAAQQLAALTGVDPVRCVAAIQQTLLAGYEALHPDTQFPAFAFRLHQFISRGDTVYASLERPDERYITLKGQKFVPDRERDKVLLPLVFCRECGQEYYVVNRHSDDRSGHDYFTPRQLRDQTKEEDRQRGFLYHNPVDPWPQADEAVLERLPEDWLELNTAGQLRVKRYYRDKLPQSVNVNTLGIEEEQGLTYQFVQSPFPFCLHCGVTYSGRERSDFGKLAALSSEGRSTATTILSLSALRALRRDETLERKAKKLLSFTDNRQDASLQAGHFNDFIEVGLLRTAVYQAVQAAGPTGIRHDELAQRIFEALDLPLALYASNPEVKFKQKQETELALREVLAYRVYQDLRRGWRVTAPNLEQAGLLKIDYISLRDLCQAEEEWQQCHPALATATPDERYEAAKVLLDLLRRELAIKVPYLDTLHQERIQQRSSLRLVEPWAIDDQESMVHATIAWPRARQKGDYGGHYHISSRSGFGMYLRRQNTFPGYDGNLKMVDTDDMIPQLFAVLAVAGLVEGAAEPRGKGDMPGYQLPADALIWLAGDGSQPYHDPVRMPRLPQAGLRSNPFFVDFYTQVATTLQGTQAREHTAQVPMEDRLRREEEFREARLPVLYCSPTMELGVDIAQLNLVNMRNVPPTPANYAQRSGRAGRSGQPALVFTYCTAGSPHDQYFFKQPERMVAGAVTPPRLDLANEDLIRAHVHAVWLAAAGLELGKSLKEILDLAGDPPPLSIVPSVQAALDDRQARQRAERRVRAILATIQTELGQASWYTADWVDKMLQQVGTAFDRACDRWRGLYEAARRQQTAQHEVMKDATRSSADKRIARQLRSEAESQLQLLTDSGNMVQSDFYSYRYFASEGFLPGYNFPRLPLSAFIPARRGRRRYEDEYLSRPRFLAISEFGPRSIIYHEGSRYVINKVILPVGEELLTSSAQICLACGYLHPVQDNENGLDLCQQCQQPLPHVSSNLFRMQNVATRRRDRINSDEEERMRMGYKLKTAVRFNAPGQQAAYRLATVTAADGTPLFKLTYGDAATLWRINLGWRRSAPETPEGFMLDTERGYWQKNERDVDPDPDDPSSEMQQRVVPYVADRRNCLLIEPLFTLEERQETMASLQPALKTAVQRLYQLEDNELAAEPLPELDDRRLILLYESAEGGAGVLRQLLDDTGALARVATEALTVCHFDEQGHDLRRAANAKEECEAACYDCLMSYYNQMDHALLDRHLVRDILLALAGSSVKASPTAALPADHLAQLKQRADSELERDWLDFLDQHRLRLPDEAQKLVEACGVRPDFWYADTYTAVFIDGPHHTYEDIQQRDETKSACLEDNLGVTVIRFNYLADWPAIVAQYPHVFGTLG
jgi:superfamily II DNA/RNA helicase